MHKARYFRGFTLIELLVVIAIIAILAALVLNTAGFIQKKGARARAEAEIAAISAALESYKADNGDYPTFNNGDPSLPTNALPTANNVLLTNLMPSSGKVYMEFNKNMLGTAAPTNLVDPFGEPYGYRYPGTNNGASFFDLWSRGGGTTTNSRIGNW